MVMQEYRIKHVQFYFSRADRGLSYQRLRARSLDMCIAFGQAENRVRMLVYSQSDDC